MHDLLTLARFELRYHFRQPYFYGLLLLMVAQGGTTGTLNYGLVADVNLLTNAPALLYLGFANVGPLLVAAVALLTGQALLRDRDYRVGGYLYTLPIAERAYFSGQFLGILGISFLLGFGYALGLLTVPLWVNGPLGSWPAGPFVGAFVGVLLPNLLVVVCLSFALTALFRHIGGAYLALLTLILGSTLLQLGYTSVVGLDWVHLLDPFGAISIRQAVETMTTTDKNTGWLYTPDLLYMNRLLWLGLSGWLLTRADGRLSFQYMLDLGKRWSVPPFWLSIYRRIVPEGSHVSHSPIEKSDSIPIITRSFTLLTRCKTVLYLAVVDARWLVRQPAVAVGLLLLALGIVAYALGFGDAPAGPLSGGQRLLPFTSRMTAIRLPMHLYISLFLVVFTGELIHRNRTSGAWYLVDATPQPGWVLLLGNAGAMLLLATAIASVLLATGLGLQLADGQTPIDWPLYARDLLTDGLLRYVQLIALATLVSAVVTNRLAGHGLVLIGLGLLTFFDDKSEGMAWWLYSILPGSRLYSDITGYSLFTSLRPVTALLWTTTAAGLLLLAVRLAQRGVLVGPRLLLRRAMGGLNGPYVASLGLLTCGGPGCLYWLKNTTDSGVTYSQSVGMITPYNTTTQQIGVGSGQRVNVIYHFVHPQNVLAVQAAVARALQQGSRWLGAFPHQTLHISETPFSPNPLASTPAFVSLPERDGWMTNTAHPDDAGQLALAVTKQVLNQWIGQGLTTINPAQSGLLTDGLAGYLALRVVQAKLGEDWLKRRLGRQEALYRRGRGQTSGREPVVMEAPGGSYVATAKAPASLTCIGEVWGHEALCRQIGRFYKSQHDRQTSPAAYVDDLQMALPNDYKYAVNYLRERPQFSFAIETVWDNDDRIGVRVVAEETLDDGLGHTHEKLPGDYIPIALLDDAGRVIHRELMVPLVAGRDLKSKAFYLPRPVNVASVVIDPLGAWPEANRADNRKLLVRKL